jgi:succinate dehydrogenase / fumarate reductase iron-sulfur subunit
MQAGGFISANAGAAPEANSIPIPKDHVDEAIDAAACIGCGACVAACPNASAMLFISAKVSQLALLPQGRPEAKERVRRMVAKADELGFGSCSNVGACEAECPKGIKIAHIARLNREYLMAAL